MKTPIHLFLTILLCAGCAYRGTGPSAEKLNGYADLQIRGRMYCGKLVQVAGKLGNTKDGHGYILDAGGEILLRFEEGQSIMAEEKIDKRARVTGILECPIDVMNPAGVESKPIKVEENYGIVSYPQKHMGGILFAIRVTRIE